MAATGESLDGGLRSVECGQRRCSSVVDLDDKAVSHRKITSLYSGDSSGLLDALVQ